MKRAIGVLCLAVVASMASSSTAAGPDKLAPEVVLLRGATLWTQGPEGKLERADLLVRDGRIQRIGAGIDAPSGAHVIDAHGKHVTPGLIDCHSHTALRGGANEGSNNVTAEVRIADIIDPDSIEIYRQLAGGSTTAHLLHGSANAIGGQDAVIKLRRDATREELLVDDAPPGIKFALGENPKRSNLRRPGQPPRYPSTRMGVIQSIRARLLATRDYVREWEEYESLSSRERKRHEPPRRDLQLETLAEILRGERRIHSHSYRQDEILALIRLAEEFGITIGTFQHVLEGYKIADEIAAHGAGASTFSDWWAYKLEAYDAIPHNGALMYERGVTVTFNSDSSELARRMNLEAAKAVKYGNVPETAALDFVTLNAARQLGLERRIGSLEPGKDADFAVWSGDPLSVYSIVEQTWVDGVREFDRDADREWRERVAREREEAIERVRSGDSPAEVAGGDEEPEHRPPDGAEPQPTTAAPNGEAPEQPSGRALAYLDRLAGSAATYSIVHATVHTVSGETVTDGTVSFRGGRIVEVGRALPPLAGAEVIDARGKHLYPGFVATNTAVGLIEISSVAGSVDLSEAGDVNPAVNVAIAVNPDSEVIPVTRANGVTHALSVPSGGLISGSSALIRLDGWTWEDLTAAAPVAIHVRWPSFRIQRTAFPGPPPSEDEQVKKRKDRLKRIRRVFADARAYAAAKQALGRGGRPFEIDSELEALLPVLDGRLPLIVHASELRQLDNALDWAEAEEGVRIIIAGAGDVWRVADRLRERGVPVIVTSVLSRPSREDEPYDTAYRVASKLHEAGVEFCIGLSGSGFGAAMARNLPYHAAMAAAFGLPRSEALRAVTLYPARILGAGSALGSIEIGKSASLLLTDGDPLEIRTKIERLFIDGRPVDPRDNRHDRLYERYRNRPRPPTTTAR